MWPRLITSHFPIWTLLVALSSYSGLKNLEAAQPQEEKSPDIIEKIEEQIDLNLARDIHRVREPEMTLSQAYNTRRINNTNTHYKHIERILYDFVEVLPTLLGDPEYSQKLLPEFLSAFLQPENQMSPNHFERVAYELSDLVLKSQTDLAWHRFFALFYLFEKSITPEARDSILKKLPQLDIIKLDLSKRSTLAAIIAKTTAAEPSLSDSRFHIQNLAKEFNTSLFNITFVKELFLDSPLSQPTHEVLYFNNCRFAVDDLMFFSPKNPYTRFKYVSHAKNLRTLSDYNYSNELDRFLTEISQASLDVTKIMPFMEEIPIEFYSEVRGHREFKNRLFAKTILQEVAFSRYHNFQNDLFLLINFSGKDLEANLENYFEILLKAESTLTGPSAENLEKFLESKALYQAVRRRSTGKVLFLAILKAFNKYPTHALNLSLLKLYTIYPDILLSPKNRLLLTTAMEMKILHAQRIEPATFALDEYLKLLEPDDVRQKLDNLMKTLDGLDSSRDNQLLALIKTLIKSKIQSFHAVNSLVPICSSAMQIDPDKLSQN